jgi:hypothetical protein
MLLKVPIQDRTLLQCCGSETKCFVSGFGSGSGLKLVSDPDAVSDPDSNPGFKSGSES